MRLAAIPEEAFKTKIRNVALCDYLTRVFHDHVKRGGHDVRHGGGNWAAEKGGEMTVDAPGQHVLERTSMLVTPEWIEVRFTVALPAKGRSICGGWANEILTTNVQNLLRSALYWDKQDQTKLQQHVVSVEDQEALRGNLAADGLCGFVVNGAVLPRASGAADLPLQGGDVVPFQSPADLEVGYTLPSGLEVKGPYPLF